MKFAEWLGLLTEIELHLAILKGDGDCCSVYSTLLCDERAVCDYYAQHLVFDLE